MLFMPDITVFPYGYGFWIYALFSIIGHHCSAVSQDEALRNPGNLNLEFLDSTLFQPGYSLPQSSVDNSA